MSKVEGELNRILSSGGNNNYSNKIFIENYDEDININILIIFN